MHYSPSQNTGVQYTPAPPADAPSGLVDQLSLLACISQKKVNSLEIVKIARLTDLSTITRGKELRHLKIEIVIYTCYQHIDLRCFGVFPKKIFSAVFGCFRLLFDCDHL